MKRIYVLIIIFMVILGVGFLVNKKFPKTSGPSLSPTSLQSLSLIPSPTPSLTATPIPTQTPLPAAYLIKNFPFQPQAPYGVWDELHDEACEEAAIVLVQRWHKGQSSLSAQAMDEEILAMVSWEIKNWGAHKDLTVKETAEMAESFYGLSLKPKYGITIEEIKKEVAQNRPVIIPTAGRLLGNPYFRSPGPVYHMLVVIGYSGNTIIVQDIGTRRGEHYEYNQKILFNAIHDWNGSPDSIEQGRKAMLVFGS